jgi:hypothetical protein
MIAAAEPKALLGNKPAQHKQRQQRKPADTKPQSRSMQPMLNANHMPGGSTSGPTI